MIAAPYDSYDFGQSAVFFDRNSDGGLDFTVKKVIPNIQKEIKEEIYTLYVSKSPEDLKRASQCKTGEVLNITEVIHSSENSNVSFRLSVSN